MSGKRSGVQCSVLASWGSCRRKADVSSPRGCRDSREAAQGAQPLVRSGATQTARTFGSPGRSLAERTIHGRRLCIEVRRWDGRFSPYTCCTVSPSFQSQFMIFAATALGQRRPFISRISRLPRGRRAQISRCIPWMVPRQTGRYPLNRAYLWKNHDSFASKRLCNRKPSESGLCR